MAIRPQNYIRSIKKIISKAKRKGWEYSPLEVGGSFERSEYYKVAKRLKIAFPNDYLRFVTDHFSKVEFSVAPPDLDFPEILVPSPSMYNQLILDYEIEPDTRPLRYMAFGFDFIFPELTIQEYEDFRDLIGKKQMRQWHKRIPILNCGDGNMFLMDCSGVVAKKGIFFWDHEVMGDSKIPPVRLASSFTAFMNLWEKVGFINPYQLVDQFYDSKKNCLDLTSVGKAVTQNSLRTRRRLRAG